MSNDAPRFSSGPDAALLPGLRTTTAEGDRLCAAVERTRNWLLAQQHPDGHWCAELEGDSILESEYLLLLAFLGLEKTPIVARLAESLRHQQAPHGGWAMFPGGTIELSGSVKAYLALRLAGEPADSPCLARARAAILSAGGIERVNSFTRYYLAMLGIISYADCPAVPPEMVLLPQWFPINLSEMSAWSRTIVVPLSLLWAERPVRAVPADCRLTELYASAEKRMPRDIQGVNHDGEKPGVFSWTTFFRLVDRGIKTCERIGLPMWRPRAVRLAEKWILDRLEMSDGLGAIFPPIVWTIIGLRSLGYPADHPVIVAQMRELDKLMVEDGDSVHLQPCLSPVWDTAISLIALRDAGVSETDPAIQKGVDWLLDHEVTEPGDWSLRHPDVPPAGWYFEYRNEFYPDVDDTAMVLIAFSKMLPKNDGESWQLDLPARREKGRLPVLTGKSSSSQVAVGDLLKNQRLFEAIGRGANWLLAMQSRDGGWGAFDADNTREFLTKVPFADHNAMIDPSTADITARVLEAYGLLGVSPRDERLQAALDFVWRDQQSDFCWIGRWGVNYLYGTWQVLQGLTAYGVSPSDPRLRRGAEWLKLKQQPNGGWGETAATYDHPELRGSGPTTASQTAWALLGLISAGEANSESARMGVDYLLSTQKDDGTWDETEFTGTGFPRVFYLRYHYYRIYFPLMALARYREAVAE
ncbi:MAG: terpene cyclase/mutase family protein [Planctomycetaceae bacterium]|nr:terpene cyclase/mutase family protein [Planctomycetaceae bacterium]